ncbi:MAG: hypothetical protein D6682_06385 [Zetaproteobacteria bacterium]|nr:MAG: hypothetical protein D6682_06385 [Zetaproteobacteria bacterium]
MSGLQPQALLRSQRQVEAIHAHLLTIRRHMERLIGENRQLRDRLARCEAELAERRERCTLLEQRLERLEEERERLRGTVDDALEQIDTVLAELPPEEPEPR